MFRVSCSLALLTFSLVLSASNDIKLDAAVFGEIQARHIGSAAMSGRTTDIAGSADRLLFATASGGLWESTDGGISVKQIFEEHTQALGSVTVDPNNPDVIWVGTGEINTRNSVSVGDGIYKSTDGGKTWKHMGLKGTERIGRIAVHPDNSDVVLVAALGPLWNAGGERGLYKTEDGGETWKELFVIDENTGCVDIDMDPQEPDTLYASMWQVRRWPHFFESGGPGSGLYKSTDGGETWNEIRNGFPEGDLGRIDLAIAPSRPNRLYAMVESAKTGLYVSDDAGNSWEMVNNSSNMIARPFYLSIVAVDPEDHNRVYNPSFTLTVSNDGGKSFEGAMFGSGVHPDFQAIWINPDDPKHVLVGTDGGVYISYDHATSWRHLATLPAAQFYHVTADDAMPYNVYGGLQDNGSWMAPSAALGGITNAHWKNIGGGDGFHVAADKTDARYVYWTIQGGKLNRYDRKTEEQKAIRPYVEGGMDKDRFNWNAGFAQSPTGGTIYYGSQYLYKSEDRGDSWTRISPDLTTNDPEKLRQEESGGLTLDITTAENHCTIITISESILDPNVIWVGTDDGNLHVTQDGGKTWSNVVTNVPDLPTATWVSGVEAGGFNKGDAFVTFDGHRTGDMKGYVYRTSDFGKTWTNLSADNIESYAHVVRQDYINPDLLFLGTEMGLYISLTGGEQWIRFTGGLPDKVSVMDMVFQKREHDLVLATHGRGIYIVDDLTPLRALTREKMAEDVVMLPTRPSYRTVGGQAFSFGGAGTFTAQNPPSGLMISYYLRKRHIFGKLRIEIYNEAGELLQELPGGKRRGINRVAWGMRKKPPRVATSRSLAFGAFFGPMVPEGKYTIKMIKGKKTYETTVDLSAHPLIAHSAEDRKLQQDAVLKLYDVQENLAYTGDALRDLRKQVSDALGGEPKKKLKKTLEELDAGLEGLQSSIVDTSDDASIFATRERLRDDVVNLYGDITGYMGRPTTNQLAQMEALDKRVAEAGDSFTKLTDLTDVNKQLEKAGVDPFTLLDRTKWEEGEAKAQGATPFIPTKKAIQFWGKLMTQQRVPLVPTLF